MTTFETFEEFLIDRHAVQYQGLDDEMPDDFNNWLGDLSAEEWIELGDEFGKMCSERTINNLDQALQRITAPLGDK